MAASSTTAPRSFGVRIVPQNNPASLQISSICFRALSINACSSFTASSSSRCTSASRFAFLAGPVLCDVLVMLLQSIIFVLISLPFGFHMQLTGMFVLAILLTLLLASVSSFIPAMALITKDEKKLSPIVQGLSLPLTLLSGMLLPMSLAPNWLQILAHFNPIYYVVEASRLLSSGQIFTKEVGIAFGVMLPFTFLMMFWATKILRKAVY